MRRLLAASLIASTALVAPAAHAQDESQEDEVSVLRAQVEALLDQVSVLTQRIDQMENQAGATQAAVAQTQASVAANIAATEANATAIAAIPEDDGIEISFGAAPEIEGPGGWTFKPRGRIQADAGFTSFPGGIMRNDGFGSELRRARLGFEGDIPGGFGYKFEVDFAGDEVSVTDAIITYDAGDVDFTVGQHKTFGGLEELTSSRFISFIERAAFTDAFGFERRLGFSGQYKNDDFLVQAGVFTDNISDLPGQSWSLDGRVVYAPELGDTQLHIGASAHYAELESGDTVRYRQRPLVHFTSERLINTGHLSADSEFGVGGELALINGPFHAAGEVYWQNLSRPGALMDPTFFGGYAEVGYFLTEGDSRGYKSFTFNRTRPANPVDEGGIGAIQVNLRYDHLDLNDGSIVGGIQNGYFASLVWIPTDYTRMIFNYGHLDYSDAIYALPGGDTSYGADVFGVRAQVDF